LFGTLRLSCHWIVSSPALRSGFTLNAHNCPFDQPVVY
jgi:hypothetical protein